MRTQSAYFADTPHTSGWLWYGAFSLAGNSVNLLYTRNAAGDYSLNRTAAGAETYYVVLDVCNLKRLPENLNPSTGLPFQEGFGAANGTPGWPAGPQGFPPFTGASQLTVSTTQPSKGLRITDVAVVYQVGVAALTSAALSLNRTTYANNVANAITNIPISATALTLTTQANPFVAVRAVTTPSFEILDLTAVSLEFNFVMANTGTIRVYGLGLHVDFNYD